MDNKIPDRLLITTSEESSWSFDRPILFLGEWCRLYSRRAIWAELDAIVAKPYGLMPEQKIRNNRYVRMLSDQLLKELAVSLNLFHQTQHDLRYWTIVVGHWVQRYVATLFNRYHAIEQALMDPCCDRVVASDAPEHFLVTNDSEAFFWAANNPTWNYALYSRILAFLAPERIELGPNILGGCEGAAGTAVALGGGIALKQKFRNAVTRVLQKCCSNSDALIINSYLPAFHEMLLQFFLGQIPQIWRTPSLGFYPPSDSARKQLCIQTEEHQGFELFVRHNISDMLPACYLEGYINLTEQANLLRWPKTPRFIFTSNNFDYDEIFKVWTASKVESGTPYFTGQHGNNYGTHVDYGNGHWPEIAAADQFFSWGWSNYDPKIVPAFAFTLAGRKPRTSYHQGGLLLVEVHVPPRIVPEDSYFEFDQYQEEQFRFAEALPDDLQSKLTVRLYGASKYLSWGELLRWKDRCPSISLDSGTHNIRHAIDSSRIVVFSYDSTGLLETLAMNIPTICFWAGGDAHLLPAAVPYYRALRDAGIICGTPEQAAEKIALNWGDVEAWWGGDKVQAARKFFCKNFANTVQHPAHELSQLLKFNA